MSQHVETHVLERSLTAVQDAKLAEQKNRERQAPEELQHLSTHYQVPIWGLATSVVAWTKFHVAFDVHFPYMPEQTEIPHDTPYFSYGVESKGVPSPNEALPDPANPDSLIAAHCQIIEWARDIDIDAVIGAVIGFGAHTAGGQGDVRYSGVLHLNFKGFGCVADSHSVPS